MPPRNPTIPERLATLEANSAIIMEQVMNHLPEQLAELQAAVNGRLRRLELCVAAALGLAVGLGILQAPQILDALGR